MKGRQWRCQAWITPKLGETVHACVLIGAWAGMVAEGEQYVV